MQKIINGKKYDTGTAAEVAEWHNIPDVTDFEYCSETLYRKRTGEYFLHGEGGARSRYAVSHGNNEWGGGESIEPLTYEAARRWAEEHMGAEAYEAEFGEVSEDGGMVAATFRISESTRAKIQREASRRGITQGEVIEALAASL